MADPNQPAKTWPEIVDSAMKYAAGGALLGAIGFFAYAGKTDPAVFTNLCVATLAGLGAYHGAAK